MSEVVFSDRLDRAFGLARQLHQAQSRKGTATPYLAHLLSVCALVIEDGGDEDQAIAALLHDAVEDQGGLETLTIIRQEFGERAAIIVEHCSDSFETPKRPWRQRKEQYLAHLKDAPPEALRVSLADKLHNARAILNDLRMQGSPLWGRFNGKREGTLWYYRSLVTVFRQVGRSPMVEELARVVAEIEKVEKKNA
jgi:(p)ppGpp synthase/HD superfamily hydrolase